MTFLLHWAGVVCLGIGALIVIALLIWAASEVAFKALKSVYGWPWLLRAIRHYGAVEPPPRFVTGREE